MADQEPRTLFSEIEQEEQLTSKALSWLARSYESMEQWKQTGKTLFYSLNGQSDVARNRLAFLIRRYFVDTPPAAEDVHRWKRDSTELGTVRVVPPKISASNSAYVNWEYIADYVLLACAAISEDLNEENQKRAQEYRQLLDSFNIRLAVFYARTIIRQNEGISDAQVLATLKTKHANAATAHVKEARKLEASGARYDLPTSPRQSPAMNRYESVYFPA